MERIYGASISRSKCLVLLVMAILFESDIQAALRSETSIKIQPIYVNSYAGLIRSLPDESAIKSRLNDGLQVASNLFSQIGVTLDVAPLRIESTLSINNPSTELSLLYLWRAEDIRQLRESDPQRNVYKQQHIVPLYFLPDMGGLEGIGDVGLTTAPDGDPVGQPNFYPAISVDFYGQRSTLAHELGHFLLGYSQFAPSFAVGTTGPDAQHLKTAKALMASASIRTDSTNLADYSPRGDLAQIDFTSVVAIDDTPPRPFVTNQVFAMMNRGLESKYLSRSDPNTSSPIRVDIQSSYDMVGQYSRRIGGFSPAQS